MYISTFVVINFVSCMQIKIHEAPTELREDQDGHYNMEKDDWANDDTGPLLEVFYNICCSFACSFQWFDIPSVLWHRWLGIRKSICPVNNWMMRYWHSYLHGAHLWYSHICAEKDVKLQLTNTCMERGADDCAYGPTDATAIPESLASLKSRLVSRFGAGLPRLSWQRGR